MPVDNKRIAGPEITQPVVLREGKRLRKPLISSDGQRQDGRKADELRPMFLRPGVVSQARGSAYIEMQRTKVTCAVYGPRESSRQQEFSQKDSEEKEFSSFVVQALEPAVCLPLNGHFRQRNRSGDNTSKIEIHDKDIVTILHLLVALARHFECPQKLPSGVTINTVFVQKKGGILEDDEGKPERDAFDALFDNAPEKLNVVKKPLQSFVNKHLSKLSLEVDNIDSQFHDGVYLIFLLGLLEGFFVPLYQYYITPANKDQKLHNVALAIDLMRDSGMKFHAKPEDVVQKDLKSTLRILYSLFQKYKNMK